MLCVIPIRVLYKNKELCYYTNINYFYFLRSEFFSVDFLPMKWKGAKTEP